MAKNTPGRRPHSMRGISRIATKQSRSFGWYVRFQRKGKVHSKWFPDLSLGGAAKALKQAKLWRDQQEATLPLPKNGKALPDKGSIIHTVCGYWRSDGTYHEYTAFKARIRVAPGRTQFTNWSIDKWGESEAFQRTQAWLDAKRKEQRQNRHLWRSL